MVVELISVVTGVSVVPSLIFVAIQTREPAKQTKLNNSIGALAGMNDSISMLHGVQQKITETPALYPYFYGEKPCPKKGRRRIQVVLITEMLADAIDYGLMVVELIPGTTEYEGWSDYARQLVDLSPVLRDHIKEHPDWYHAYARLLEDHPSQNGPIG